jgi:hypothetical protein
MARDILDEVLEALTNSRKKPAPERQCADFFDKRYKPIPLSKENFHLIGKAPSRGMAFIDGSNVEILGAPDFSLQLIRTYATVHRENKREFAEKKEFFVLASVEKGETTEYRINSFPEGFECITIEAFDETLKTGNERVAVSRVGELVRSIAEIKESINVLSKLGAGDLVVRDGTLQPRLSFEAEYFKDLFSAARKREIAVAGLAKTTDLITDNGASLVAALEEMAPDGAWYYWPVVENSNSVHQAEIFLVKLHALSKYVFRAEIDKEADHEIVLSNLAANSTDPVFLGYPYGLVEAHRSAKINFQERLQLRTMLQAKAGTSWTSIEKSVRSLDAHDVLDRM